MQWLYSILFQENYNTSTNIVENDIEKVQSEEAFGVYVASRLMDFSEDIRKRKKAKIFQILEDLKSFESV